MTSFWHPFANMAAVQASGELSIVRGEGYYVWDDQGRRYLDATASLWYCNVGHGRSGIAEAVATQMRELETYSTFQDLTSPVVAALAERVHMSERNFARGAQVRIAAGEIGDEGGAM